MKISEYRTLPVVSQNPVVLQFVERTALGSDVRPESVIIAQVSAGIIKGIQFPRTGEGSGLSLSPTDCEEIISIVSYTLTLRGVFAKGGNVSKRDFLACRKAVRKNDSGLCLHRGGHVDLSVIVGFVAAKTAGGEREPLSVAQLGAINARYRFLNDCIAMAFKRDKDAGNKQAVTKAARAKYILEMAKIEALTGFPGTVNLPAEWRDNTRLNFSPAQVKREKNRGKSARNDAKEFFLAYVNEGKKAIEAI